MRHKFLRISAVTSARRRARRTWFSRRNRSPGVARVSVGLVYDCVEPPTAGDTLELVLAAIVEGEAGARHEIFDGLRDKYSEGPACPATRAPIVTLRPPILPSISSHSPVCVPARTSIPRSRTCAVTSRAQRIARAGPSKVA